MVRRLKTELAAALRRHAALPRARARADRGRRTPTRSARAHADLDALHRAAAARVRDDAGRDVRDRVRPQAAQEAALLVARGIRVARSRKHRDTRARPRTRDAVRSDVGSPFAPRPTGVEEETYETEDEYQEAEDERTGVGARQLARLPTERNGAPRRARRPGPRRAAARPDCEGRRRSSS